MGSIVKEEMVDTPADPRPTRRTPAAAAPPPKDEVIDLSSSDSDFDADEEGYGGRDADRLGLSLKKVHAADFDLPLGFLDPLPPEEPLRLPPPPQQKPAPMALPPCKQFWKAGDFDEIQNPSSTPAPAPGMDHVRVHPKFLHSNATSHKWALGALAELLDNSLDEVCNGATFVNIDMLINKKNESKMLLVEDNGGGMDPDKMRQCMSLGYSAKSKTANSIGQYGNGFKTSTMRIGADAIVFSRSRAKDGKRPTQSIGMLSYTFLRSTGKEDIVVPMLDYEKNQAWNKILRSSFTDWNSNLETIVEWSPYSSEVDLLQQFSSMKDQGTRIIIYNLWEDDQGELELDFDTDKHDIQIRGVNRDEKNIEMAKKFPNSMHFLTYRHSLRVRHLHRKSYASILYLRLPHVFRMILRGKEIEHHNIVNDMMLKHEVTYRPQTVAEGLPKDPNMVAVVTIGFVKDAKHHIDIQGFNVYHKNRLIKPFWRLWSAAGSDGRGVIGVLEANFVEPAHDKQDFERTTILSRLEARLVQMQKTYWSSNCDKIGYAPRIRKRNIESEEHESSPEPVHQSSKKAKKAAFTSSTPHMSKAGDKVGYEYLSGSTGKTGKASASAIASGKSGNWKGGNSAAHRGSGVKSSAEFDNKIRAPSTSHGQDVNDESDDETELIPSGSASHGSISSLLKMSTAQKTPGRVVDTSTLSSSQDDHTTSGVAGSVRITTRSQSKEVPTTMSNQNEPIGEDSSIIQKLKDENEELKKRITNLEQSDTYQELQHERKRNKSLSEQIEELKKKLEEQNNEQEALIDIFSEERNRRDKEDENMRKKLKDASGTIQELLEKLSKAQNSNR